MQATIVRFEALRSRDSVHRDSDNEAFGDLKESYTDGVRETLTGRGGVSSVMLCPEISSVLTVWM